MKDVWGAVLAGSSPPFLGRERAAVDVDPERRSPRYHEFIKFCCFLGKCDTSGEEEREPLFFPSDIRPAAGAGPCVAISVSRYARTRRPYFHGLAASMQPSPGVRLEGCFVCSQDAPRSTCASRATAGV